MTEALEPAFSPRRWALWLLVAVGVAVLPPACGFQFKDGDSDLYAVISGQLAHRPFSEWLSPQWPVPSYKSGLFQEHMAFFFWPPALLGMLGVPPIPAALFCNALYLVFLLAVMERLGRRLTDPQSARVSMLLWVVGYAGIQYVIRNNHETPLALAVVLGVLAVVEAPTGRRFLALAAAAGAACVAMKGIVGVVVLPSLAVWAWVLGGGTRRWAAVASAALGAAALFGIHDVLFAAANGHSFLQAYVTIHMGYAADREKASVLRKLSNIAYYAGVAVYWAAPASLALLWQLWDARRTRTPLPPVTRAALLTVVVYVLFFSVFDRRASRYIFSVHPLVMVAAGPAAWALLQRIRVSVFRRWDALPLACMLLTLMVAGVRTYVHNHHYTFFSPNNPRAADAGSGAPANAVEPEP